MNVLYLGSSGFPYGLAEIQRIQLISKALIEEGCHVYVINRRGVHSKKTHPNLNKAGRYSRVVYIYTSSPYRLENFIERNSKKIVGFLLELVCIFKIHHRKTIDAVIVSSMSFWDLLFYKMITWILGVKLLLNYVEYNSSMVSRKKLKLKVNDYFFDKYAIRVSDGILPISEFLIQKIKEKDKSKPFLKIPVLTDINRYSGITKDCSEKYILFCGAAGYIEVINFIIDTFEILSDNSLFLYLVVNGKENHLLKLQNRIINSAKSSKIRVFSSLSDNELSHLYYNASGLLIPLRPTLQDKARFPHKIGEYLASGNVIITTNYGEVKYYFHNKENALIAENYNIKEYAMQIEYLLLNHEESRVIGTNGKKLCQEYFNYQNYGNPLVQFINSLN